MTWRIGAGSAFRHYLLTGSMASVFVLAACGDDDTAKTLTVADPVADKELTLAVDDTDPDTEGLQYDVQVESSGLVEGTPLILIVDDKQVGQGELGSDGKMTLPGITLEPGQKTIVARTTLAEITSDKEQQYIYRMLRIASPSAGAVDEDADATTDGMQVAVSVEAFAIEGDVILVVDGEEQDDTSAVTEGVASFQVTLTAGSHTLAAKSGDVVSEDVAIFVQRACGSIALVSPKAAKDGRVVLGGADGTCPADGEPYIGTFEVSTDVGNGLTARLFVNDMMAATAKVDGTLATFDDVTLGMRTTASTIKVEVDTKDGTCSKSFDVDVFVDCAGPDCEITSPTPKVVTSGSTTTQYLNGDIGDGTFEVAVASSADLVGRSVSLIVDGNSTDALSEDAVADGSAAKATFDVALADGAHTVRARCVDAAGNVTSSAVKNWTVDVTPCAVALTSPVADAKILLADDEDTGATGTQTLVSATVTGSDCAEARASVCDTGAAVGDYATYASGAPFTVTLDDSTIDQSLCVDVRDVAGNVGFGSVAVEYFSTVPTLEILSPTDGAKFNTTGDDSLAEAFEADVDTNAAGCQADFQVACSEVGLPVELVRIPSNSSMSEIVLGTADCNEAASGASSPGVAVFNTISIQDSLDPNPSFVARQTYVGDGGTQQGQSAGIALSGQCESFALAYSASLRNGGASVPLSVCPARVGTTGVTLDVTVDVQPTVPDLAATLTALDAAGTDVTIPNNTANAVGGTFYFTNRGITVGSVPSMQVPNSTDLQFATVTVDVTDAFNNTAQISCEYNVSDSNLMLTASVPTPPGGMITASSADSAACPNVDVPKYRVPVELVVDTESAGAPSERALTYAVDGGLAVPVSITGTNQIACVEVPEGGSAILARLRDTRSADFDMQMVAVDVDTLNLTAPANNATYSAPSSGCAAGEIRVSAAVHPMYADGDAVTITTGAGTANAQVSGDAISACVAVAVGTQNVSVTLIKTGATQTAAITWFSDPGNTGAVSFTTTLPSEAIYRTSPVAIGWTLPTGTFNFSTAEMRCSQTALASGADATAWWNGASEHLDAKGLSRYATTAGQNPTSGTYDIPTGAPTANCLLRLCDAAARCTPLASTSTPIAKPFRASAPITDVTAQGLGRAAEPVGDVNGDGYPDVVISALSGGTPDAAVYLYFGRGDTNLPSTSAVKISLAVGGEAYGAFGSAIAGIGDINGDGHADFAVGRPNEPVDGNDTAATTFDYAWGAVYIFFGRDAQDPWPTSIVLPADGCGADVCILHGDDGGNVISASLGTSIAGLGQFDGQGGDDFAIGGPYTSRDFTSLEGAVYIVSGTGFPVCPDPTCSTGRSGQTFGTSLVLSPNGNGTSASLTAYYMEGTGLTPVPGGGSFDEADFGSVLAATGPADGADSLNDLVIGAGKAQKLFFVRGRAFQGSGVTALSLATDATEIPLTIPTLANANYLSRIRMLGNIFDPSGGTAGMPDLGVYFNSQLGIHILPGNTSTGFAGGAGDVLYVRGPNGARLGTTTAGGLFPAVFGTQEADYDGDGETDLLLGTNRTSDVSPEGAYYFTGDSIVRNTAATSGTSYVSYGSTLPQQLSASKVSAKDVAPASAFVTNAANLRGRSVQYAGDLTGDGAPDLIVGDLVKTGEPTGGFHILY